MIQVKVYNNGYEIIGHAKPEICSEVSILAWSCWCTISYLDDGSKYYTSKVDNKENSDEGYTWFTFDPRVEKANWVFNQWKRNQKIWGDALWKPSDVQVTHVDGDLVK